MAPALQALWPAACPLTLPMTPLPHDPIEADFLRELREIEAEAMGWQALEPGVYLHAGDPQAETITVVGLPDIALVGQAVLLVGHS